jgi:hypothetical protein
MENNFPDVHEQRAEKTTKRHSNFRKKTIWVSSIMFITGYAPSSINPCQEQRIRHLMSLSMSNLLLLKLNKWKEIICNLSKYPHFSQYKLDGAQNQDIIGFE